MEAYNYVVGLIFLCVCVCLQKYGRPRLAVNALFRGPIFHKMAEQLP